MRVSPGCPVLLGVMVEGPRGWCLSVGQPSGPGSSPCHQSPNSSQDNAGQRAESKSSSTEESSISSSSSVWRWSDAMLHVRGPLPLAAPSPVRMQLLPSWHFDMILDQKRNEAYELALRLGCFRKLLPTCHFLPFPIDAL
eukprot:1139018-Pelagomonas_calceolata.AAC.15